MKPIDSHNITNLSPLLERFLAYVQFDTQSCEDSATTPSTPGQRVLLERLFGELKALPGVSAAITPEGYVTACLPASPDAAAVPPLGFIAHVDTSPETSGRNVRPQLVPGYDGTDIELAPGVVLSPAVWPELLDEKGHLLVVTDGTTLLGADDKAGVAEIMETMVFLAAHPEVRHGSVWVAFTPDEEIGRGTDHFPLRDFGASFALTVDGGACGELQYENFNAAAARVEISGRCVHPGEAKDKMRNAISVAMQFDAMLPARERPEHTEGYEGFFHLLSMQGTVESAVLEYIVRDHDAARFDRRKQLLEQAAGALNAQYGPGTVRLALRDQYRNMRDRVLPRHATQLGVVETAMRRAGVEPLVRPIRGGTDGAMLSFKGLPCPNLFTGGHNFHGRFEYIAAEAMEKACDVLRSIVTCWAEADHSI